MILFFMILKKRCLVRIRNFFSRRKEGVQGIKMSAQGGGRVGPRHIIGILLCKLNKFKLFTWDPFPDPPPRSAHECVFNLQAKYLITKI